MRWVLGLMCAASVMLVSCTRTVEESMLLQGPSTPLLPDDVWHEAVEFKTPDGVKLRGILIRSRDRSAPPRPLVVFYYGWGQTVASSTPSLYRLASRCEVDVLSMDMRGIGSSSQLFLLQALDTEPAQADAAVDDPGTPPELPEQFTIQIKPPSFDMVLEDTIAIHDEFVPQVAEDGQPVYVLGHSLGTTLAIEVGARRELAGVMLASGLTSAKDWARHIRRTQIGWPARIFFRLRPGHTLTSRTQPIERIGEVDEPILLVHGLKDRITPPGFARRLAQAAGTNARLIEIPGQGHVLDLTASEPVGSIRAFIHGERDPG